jgi:hypothetical protein
MDKRKTATAEASDPTTPRAINSDGKKPMAFKGMLRSGKWNLERPSCRMILNRALTGWRA